MTPRYPFDPVVLGHNRRGRPSEFEVRCGDCGEHLLLFAGDFVHVLTDSSDIIRAIYCHGCSSKNPCELLPVVS